MSEVDNNYQKSVSEEEMGKDSQTQVQLSLEQMDEVGGPEGLEPTRYGDWERKGRCIDF